MKSHPLAGTNGQLMITAAHRYCLGRQTYIVGSCVEWLRRNWKLVDHETRSIVLRDTVGTLMDNDAGAACDVKEWKQFARWAFEQEDDSMRARVKASLLYKQKEWPL